MECHAVAVIMPTYNSGKYLRQCLDSFKRQTFEDWVLVCVDRGSTDDTLSILREYQVGWDKLRILDGGDERTSQINIGIRATQSTFVYYTASDFDVDDTLLAEAVLTASNQQADGVFIDCLSYGDGLWARVRNLERRTYIGSVKFEAARFLRRSSYDAAGGYDDSVPIFEEYDLQDRLAARGARFGRISAVERHLGEPESLKEIWKKSFYYGTRYKDLVVKQGVAAVRHTNPIRGTFFRHAGSFVQQPFLALAFVVMLLTKYGAGGCGFLYAIATSNVEKKRAVRGRS